MQFEYDPEQLIAEVSKRRAIWDNSDPGYRAKHLKSQLWSDIVKELVSTNDISMSKSELRELEIQLQKKWKSLRDCYKKYIANPNKFKRPYVFATNLNFLFKDEQWPERKKMLAEPVGASDSDEGDSQRKPSRKLMVAKRKIRIHKREAESDDNDNYGENFNDLEFEVSATNEGETSAAASSSGQFAFANVDAPKNDNEDTDKMFLLSLLPHLRSIPEEFRLNVKLELMQVLRVANDSTAKFKYSNRLD